MKKNMNSADRIFRLLLVAIIAVLYFTNTITGTWGMVLLILGIVFVLTSIVGFCPLYAVFGISSNKKTGHTHT